MGQAVAKSKSSKEERERKLLLKHRYESRITIARSGKAAFSSGDYVMAIRRYTEYLNIFADIYECDIHELGPQHFDKQKDLTEMLLISHIFFELAKMYDATTRFPEECQNCLNSFVLFSANQPYQVLNSEMIRKSIRKTNFRDPQKFHTAYMQIFVQSKKCYVVTYCYGDQHEVTRICRSFKDDLLKYHFGQTLVAIYYRISSRLVEELPNYPMTSRVLSTLSRPVLKLFSSFYNSYIIK